jgi:D-aminopeptidase
MPKKSYPRGEKNSITDVRGVKVGHLTINRDVEDSSGKRISVRTGLTAVHPYPLEKPMRVFCGSLVIKGRGEVTGYEVIDDFCYLNSPVVLANSFSVGRIYNAILTYGFALGRDELWPPLVIGINDSLLNDIAKYELDEEDIVRAFAGAGDGPVDEGSVGIGVGLGAFDSKGGVATSSRLLAVGSEKFTFGVLAASNHANSNFREGSLTLVFGTDIPILPHQIRQVLRALISSVGLPHTPENFQDSLTAVLFTTANPMGMAGEGSYLFDFRAIDDSFLGEVVDACHDAAGEAIIRSLAKATPVVGRLGRRLERIPETALSELKREFERRWR